MRTITRVSPNISHLNRIPNGPSEGLKRAPDPAAWFRAEYDKDQRDFGAGAFDVWEIAPLGRYNDGLGQWRWPSRAEFDGFWRVDTTSRSSRTLPRMRSPSPTP